MKTFEELRKLIDEDERLDTRNRTEAHRAFELLKNFIDKRITSTVEVHRTFQIFPLGATIAAPGSFLGLPKEYSDLVVSFGSLHKQAFGTVSQSSGYSNPFFSFIKDANGNTLPVIFLPVFKGAHINLDELRAMTSDDEDSFVHEFIHYLDYKRSKSPDKFIKKLTPGKGAGVDVNSFQSMYDYVNSPVEFNAYYQGLVHKIQAIADSQDMSKEFDTFSKFMDRVRLFMPSFFRELLNDEYKRRLIKRLYTFWKEKFEQFQDK